MINKMKKIIVLFLLMTLLSSCATTKIFEHDNGVILAKPYGWANKNVVKDERVVYQINPGNTVISVLGIQTLVIPVWLTGWQLFEPVKLKETK
jgi:hypothetical protein